MPDLIFSSTALLAKATATCICKKINFPIIKITFLRELYHASANRLFDYISQAPDQKFDHVFWAQSRTYRISGYSIEYPHSQFTHLRNFGSQL